MTRFDKPAMHVSMLIPLLLMAVAFMTFYAAALIARMRAASSPMIATPAGSATWSPRNGARWRTMREFLAMGGYGAYVWSAYAIAGVVLAWNAYAACTAARRQLARLACDNDGQDDDTTP